MVVPSQPWLGMRELRSETKDESECDRYKVVFSLPKSHIPRNVKIFRNVSFFGAFC